ncbi:hypothetical protein QJS10_CPB15g00881 [Acorus calamus]|uniref:Protein TILLER ANGLE CONTROL 1 n=1 Tax=Acorus calamus TaxID=4465 RepID=A0AAV9D3Q4_ACOCL|nr:hypothetical protein QJS10_CPB15g00881 [Acorus calamus]
MITPFEIEMQKVSEDQFGSSKEEISKPLLSDQPPNAGPMIESKIRKRTTLADLFSADVDVPEYGKADDGVPRLPPVAPDSSDSKPVTGEARRSFSKIKGSSIVKKLVMPYKGKGSPPKKKIDQLMTKMLKKKIHPSVEREINGPGVRSVNMMSTMDVEAEGSRIGCVSLF